MLWWSISGCLKDHNYHEFIYRDYVNVLNSLDSCSIVFVQLDNVLEKAIDPRDWMTILIRPADIYPNLPCMDRVLWVMGRCES